MTRIASDTVGRGRVVPVEIDGAAFVVWRTADGRLGSTPRWCPHLDQDLADAEVVGTELVCPSHGWSFACGGHAFKRNELGRVDPKGDVETLQLSEDGAHIEATRRAPAG